ncbi:YppG family protein [Virgibacillus necropolis]|uniref:YppG family protein n=1 Tax=Virgibacillus necropolis TaxID=163877 RepID=UPI0038512E4A
MFNRPNDHQRPFNYNPNHPQYHKQQWNHQNIPPYKPTPYQYYAKPKQPVNWHTFSQPNQNHNAYHNQHNQPPAKSFLNHFQDKNGEVDVDKMLSTVGQVANTFKQVSPMIKQFGSIMKTFK